MIVIIMVGIIRNFLFKNYLNFLLLEVETFFIFIFIIEKHRTPWGWNVARNFLILVISLFLYATLLFLISDYL